MGDDYLQKTTGIVEFQAHAPLEFNAAVVHGGEEQLQIVLRTGISGSYQPPFLMHPPPHQIRKAELHYFQIPFSHCLLYMAEQSVAAKDQYHKHHYMKATEVLDCWKT